MPIIRLEHSLIRNLLFPIYGRDQAVFILVLVPIFYLTLYHFNPGFALIGTIAGWGGGVGASIIGAPAVVRITAAQHAGVIAELQRRRFVHELASDSWVAPLPRWLRWHHARVSHIRTDDGLIDLKGPRVILKNLVPLSDTRLFVTPLW